MPTVGLLLLLVNVDFLTIRPGFTLDIPSEIYAWVMLKGLVAEQDFADMITI